MSIDEIHEFIDLFPDSDFLIGIHWQSLLDLIEETIFGFIQGGIDMIQDLFSELFKILFEFFNSIVSLFLFGLEHTISFMFQISLPIVQFLLTLSSWFFVDLVLSAASVEVKSTVVKDLRIVLILVLHAFLQVHDFIVFW